MLVPVKLTHAQRGCTRRCTSAERRIGAAAAPVMTASQSSWSADEPEPTAEAQVAKMDPDGDGRIGGAPKGGNRKAKAKA